MIIFLLLELAAAAALNETDLNSKYLLGNN